MNRPARRAAVAGLSLLAVLLMAPLASATTIDDLTLGETWYGEPLKPADLKGRVVLVEFWGYN